MNALVLPGMSVRHKEWARQVAEVLRPKFGEVRFLDYKHWDAPGTQMDLEYELAQAAKLAEGLDEYVVVGKSVGTILATLGTARGLFRPQRCVFLGFPHNGLAETMPEVATALPHLPYTVFVHNEHDPVGDARTVQQYVQAHSPKAYDFQIIPGDKTHDYVDLAQIAQLAIF